MKSNHLEPADSMHGESGVLQEHRVSLMPGSGPTTILVVDDEESVR